MVVKHLRPGRIMVDVSLNTFWGIDSSSVMSAPGGLHPLRHATWVTDPYRVIKGWPRPIPECDINIPVLVSCEGEVISDRPIPKSVDTGAFTRWVSDVETYSDTELRWETAAGNPNVWETTTENAPTLIHDYEYSIDKERFIVPALIFDADAGDYMTGTFSELSGAAGYTVVMALSLNSVNAGIRGLWCPTDKTGGWVSVTTQGTALYVATEQSARQQVMPLAHLIENTAPIFLAMVFNRPYTKFYAAAGPSAITSRQVNVGTINSNLNPGVYLGRTMEDNEHNSDMAVLDIGIYAEALTGQEVREEFATLSSIYGGDR